MLNQAPVCPQCGQADKAYKVSLLYQESSARISHHEKDHQPELDGLLSDLAADPSRASLQTLHRLMQSFAPPASENRPSRTLSPDIVAVAFGLIMLVLVSQVAARQPENFPLAVGILFAAGLAYLLFRRPIMQHYRARISEQQETDQRLQEATSRWMRLYYCSRDQGVFDPQQNRIVPVEQIQNLVHEI
jgi:hypothetical protein